MKVLDKYILRKEKHLKKFNVDINPETFAMLKLYSTIVGFGVGFIAASISLLTEGNLIASVIIGTAFTVIGNCIPEEVLKLRSNRNNKIHKKELMKEYEEFLLNYKEMKTEEKTIEELMNNKNKNKEKLVQYIEKEHISSLQELEEKIKKMN